MRLPPALQALKHRNYRLLWTGNLVSVSGDAMDQIAFSWLVYDMTGSPIALAAINLCRAIPILIFTLLAGVVADRFERRKMMFTTQSIAMLLALLLAILVSTHLIEVWMVFAVAMLRGITNSFNMPARQTLISDLVPPEDLPRAVALNAATNSLTRVLGPSIGGILIATVGVAGAFYFNAFSFIAVLYSLAAMRFPPMDTSRRKEGVLSDLTSGFKYLKQDSAMRVLVILALVPVILGQPYQTMLTVFAKDVFHAGSSGLGLMQSMTAIGSVTGAILVASYSNLKRFNYQMIFGLIGFGSFLVLFTLMPGFWIALPMLLGVGFSRQTYQTSNNTLIQMNVAPEYRGRVLSTLFLERGLQPLGTMFAGIFTTLIGPRATIGGMASMMVLMGFLALPLAMGSLTKLSSGAADRRAARQRGEPVPAEAESAGN